MKQNKCKICSFLYCLVKFTNLNETYNVFNHIFINLMKHTRHLTSFSKYQYNCIVVVSGRVVRVVDSESLTARRFRFQNRQERLESFMRGSYSASLRNVDGSTEVSAHA